MVQKSETYKYIDFMLNNSSLDNHHSLILVIIFRCGVKKWVIFIRAHPSSHIYSGSFIIFTFKFLAKAIAYIIRNLFMDVINLVSKLIGSDWVKLYYSLPFYPERGSEIIQKDIDKIFKLYYRGNCEKVKKEKAFNSLIKWKRVHHRSKLDDICQALKKIKRVDILKEVKECCVNYENKCKEPSNQLNKRSSIGEEDIKKKDAEILHQQLCKFFESKNTKTKHFDFKFCSKNSQ
ncbi:hypothetical protein BpHYR1_003682 [Brachionus plicatilis]|uniref:Death domain-containing protein n=1 Tax=Brachionus plicatilis TaxID=10195 RepID=A0A3M7RSP9_BRAPC|nr:hypothetical protein BpHYR1_003682 [Brachionus plicatilis]